MATVSSSIGSLDPPRGPLPGAWGPKGSKALLVRHPDVRHVRMQSRFTGAVERRRRALRDNSASRCRDDRDGQAAMRSDVNTETAETAETAVEILAAKFFRRRLIRRLGAEPGRGQLINTSAMVVRCHAPSIRSPRLKRARTASAIRRNGLRVGTRNGAVGVRNWRRRRP